MADSRTFLQLPAAIFKHQSSKNSSKTFKQESTGPHQQFKKKIHKCSQKCKKHLFSMVRISGSQDSSALVTAKYGIQHRFCPSFNKSMSGYFRLIGIQEGGIPEFNRDSKIETPSFLTKYEMANSQISTNTICRQRFRQNLAKATNSTIDGAQPFQKQLSEPDFNKIKDDSLHQIIGEFMQILKIKEASQFSQKYLKK